MDTCACRNEFGSFRPFVRPFPTQDLRISSSVFLVFYMKLDSLIEVIRSDFCKKVLTVKDRPKSPKNGLKMKFLELRQKSNLSISTFLPEYDITNCLPTFCNGSNKFIQSFQVGMVRHAWTCLKLFQIVYGSFIWRMS